MLSLTSLTFVLSMEKLQKQLILFLTMTTPIPPLNTERVKIVEFTNKQLFELYPDKEGYTAIASRFLSSILDKLVSPTASGKENPFYAAYTEDLKNNISPKNPILLNYQLLMFPEV